MAYWLTNMANEYVGEEELKSPEDMAMLNRLVDGLDVCDSQIDALEDQLKLAKEERADLADRKIPILMMQLGVAGVTTDKGVSVNLKKEVRMSLPKEETDRRKLFDWLKQNNHDGLIKNTVTVTMGVQQDGVADEVEKYLRDFPTQLSLSRKKDINHQTGLAFIREQLANEETVPLELFGAYEQQTAKVKRK